MEVPATTSRAARNEGRPYGGPGDLWENGRAEIPSNNETWSAIERNGWMDGWMDGWIDKLIDLLIDQSMDRSIYIYIYSTDR